MTAEATITETDHKIAGQQGQSREWEESEWFQRWLDMNRERMGNG